MLQILLMVECLVIAIFAQRQRCLALHRGLQQQPNYWKPGVTLKEMVKKDTIEYS